ncbi:Acyl transferase/acyl hydrolase/lysophospholipase [Penicillium fimorum]|uniref:Acyl transferase/acyl hydrolase/lysophospholipase n=1 Tax=Penicillium fimorum TaxID=1882269 RepID=A0A9W9XTL4_9EURO|nr:Acyl transferase/acyl hydrolase/lysophospholipase [Penicillium fimorum]
MKNGARNFAFLPRYGAYLEQASLVVDELKAAGATVQVFRGDAGLKSDIEEVINSVPENQPVRGVINAVMTLSYENWALSVHPKVTGTKNLHEAPFHLSLDLFVTTSSVSGVLGTPGQSNYAAENSYIYALARHRRSYRQNSVLIVLPMVLGVGVAAENSELEESLGRKGIYGIDEETLLHVFDIVIIEQVREGISDQKFIYTVQAVHERFITKLARMLMLGMNEFEEESRSMNGAEFRDWIVKELGLDIPFQQLLGPI